jgi:hypothetical protein
MTSMGERRGSYKGLDETPEEKGNLEDISVDRSIILKWVLEKSVGRAWTGLILLHVGISGGLL